MNTAILLLILMANGQAVVVDARLNGVYSETEAPYAEPITCEALARILYRKIRPAIRRDWRVVEVQYTCSLAT